MKRRRIALILLAVVLAAVVSARILRRPGRPPAILDLELTWGTTPADSAETRHLPFEIREAGCDYRLWIRPLMDSDRPTKQAAHLRARILKPDASHLVGMDFRLYPEEHRSLFRKTKVWPTGSVNFRPETPGRYILQLQRHEPEVHRARVRIEGPLR